MGLNFAVIRRNLENSAIFGYTWIMRVLYFGGIPLSVLYGKYNLCSKFNCVIRTFNETPNAHVLLVHHHRQREGPCQHANVIDAVIVCQLSIYLDKLIIRKNEQTRTKDKTFKTLYSLTLIRQF
jgi:hypothetical protein